MCLPYIPWRHDDPSWHYVLIHCTSPDCLKRILDHGVNPDVAEEGQFTMLHHIVTLDVTERVRLALAMLLLDAGASLSPRDSMLQSTPLGWACRWGHRELVELYLERGADAAEPDAEPWATPLAWVNKNGYRDIAEMLSGDVP